MNVSGITWRPRETPIPATCAAAAGAAARALARRLLEESDDVLGRLRGVAGSSAGLDVLAVLGETDALPWVDGVVYLGADPRAARLLLPTALEPHPPVELVDLALAARFPGTGPLVVLAGANLLVPVTAARPIDRETLARWIEGEN